MATILVVDDEPANRALIGAYLTDSGHTLLHAASGAEALALASGPVAPDLVLLDVLMPGMNGLEVARRLKAGTEIFLPIILVTALTDQESRRRGLLAGADDYLTKPVDPQELELRVRNLLMLRDKERALLERNVEHVELHRFREEMSALLAHDLKNPLAAMLANLGYVRDNGGLSGEALEALEESRVSGRRIADMLLGFIDSHRLEAGRLALQREEVDASSWIGSIVQSRVSLARQRGFAIHVDSRVNQLDCDRTLLTRAIENILDNAMRHTPEGGKISIQLTGGRHGVAIRLGNSGPPIPPPMRARVFEKYGCIGASGRSNFGLGLYFCRLVAEAHGGDIRVEETAELPTVFVIELPAEGANVDADTRRGEPRLVAGSA